MTNWFEHQILNLIDAAIKWQSWKWGVLSWKYSTCTILASFSIFSIYCSPKFMDKT